MGITPEELARIVAAHGGQIGAVPVDPTITSKIGSTSVTEDNPNPQFRLILRDGTTITVRSASYGPNGEVADWDVTDPGTAVKQASTAPLIRDDPSGNPAQWDPESKTWKAPPGMAPKPATVKLPTPSKGPLMPSMIEDETGVRPGYTLDPNWDYEAAELDKEYRRAQLANLQRQAAGSSGSTRDPTAAMRLAWEQSRYPEEQARKQYEWEQEQADKKAAREGQQSQWARQNEQARDQLASGLGQWMTSERRAAAPYYMLPDQTHFLGTDLAEQSSRQLGIPFNRDAFRVQPVEFDPIKAWRLAQGEVRR